MKTRFEGKSYKIIQNLATLICLSVTEISVQGVFTDQRSVSSYDYLIFQLYLADLVGLAMVCIQAVYTTVCHIKNMTLTVISELK